MVAGVVVDNQNKDAKTRAKYVALARKHGVAHVRCFFFTLPKALAFHLQEFRAASTTGAAGDVGRRVPAMVIHSFYKKVQPPKLSEGFTQIAHVNFQPRFGTDRERQLFWKHLCA